ncbi:MAG TPA: DUF397 domain-containing protein [Streptosporangiaceae bacterium]|nr:DUF397 domain-containing protein [Streptosporangiaceae bacterium]
MWRTPSRSAGTDCVEAASWRTSTASHANGNCVEAGCGAAVVLVRDTQDRGGALLVLPPAAWTAFTARLKSGPRRA